MGRHKTINKSRFIFSKLIFFKEKELAQILDISPATLKMWRIKGCGPRWIKMSDGRTGSVRYDKKDVLKWIEKGKLHQKILKKKGGKDAT